MADSRKRNAKSASGAGENHPEEIAGESSESFASNSMETTGGEPDETARLDVMSNKLAGALSGSADDAGEYNFTVEDAGVMTDLDPQLQKMVTAREAGREMDAALVAESDDGEFLVDVLAVLKEPEREVQGLNVGSIIGDVVTGSVAVDQIESVREDPNVISLKAARRVSPNLRISIPEIRARQSDIRSAFQLGNSSIDGSGVIVGVVDYGCDFAHPCFRKADGTTRLLYLWDQNRPANSMSPSGYNYGREFTRERLNQALQTSDPSADIGYFVEAEEHGTHVMDIAAGNGRGTGSPGVAPNADLIFVQLSTEGGLESFGNSRRLLEAVQYIFRRAAEAGKPAVVNLSLGTHGGPHDGSTPAERGFDFLLTERPGRAIVISAGNSFDRRSHARGSLAPNQSRILRWEIFPTDRTSNELEVWFGGAGQLEATLIAPNNQRVGTARIGETKNINLQNQLFAQIFNRAADPLNGDNQINVFLRPGFAGVWGVELRNTGQTTVDFDAWIERDDDPFQGAGYQSRFVAGDADASRTIGSISCGKKTIVVGSYDAAVTNRDMSFFSSAGPTRDGKQKPEISAPGHRIAAANSTSLPQATTVMSGTSMAAPHIAGVVALLMQAAGGGASNLSIDALRDILFTTGRKTPQANNQSWNPRYGMGRVETVAALGRLVPAVPQPNGHRAASETALMLPGGEARAFSPVKEMIDLIAGASDRAKVTVRLEIELEPVLKN